MTPVSLRQRFFLHSALTLLLLLLVSMLIVDYSYRSELMRSVDQRLRLHIFNLLSIAQKVEQTLLLPDILRNPSFNTLNSGLWAMVLDKQNQPIWQSLSLEQPPALQLTTQATGSWLLEPQQMGQQTFLSMSYQIAWDTPEGLEHYRFIAAEDERLVQQEINHFRWWLGGGFALLTLSLLVGQQLVLRAAFRPIRDLEQEIMQLEQGQQKQLLKPYPQELEGVAHNLNTLIQKEHQQREKYRSGMADLAHSLKTPLTIIKGELHASARHNKVLQTAISRIDQSIEYQLRRAVISGHSLLHQGTPVADVLQDLILVLERAHQDEPIKVTTNIQSGLNFYGDENDLLEILGNLLDNAFRYAKQEVRVTASWHEQQLLLQIEDDGQGFSEQQATQIFKRGERLDQQGLGQGIGLSVVFDIVNSYQGQITAGRSSMGGACFTLVFPSRKEKI